MSLVELTSESMSQLVGEQVPDAYLLVAKNSVLGLDVFAISELLGVEIEEVQEILNDDIYKSVRLIVAAKHSEQSINTDFTWDDIEARALKNIAKRVDFETSIETNLRIAAVANRAQRRHQVDKNQPLDAGTAGKKVNLTLTRRIRERLMHDGSQERETTEQISIRDGSMGNPSFAELDRHLDVSGRTRIPSNLSFRTAAPADPDRLDQSELSRLLSEAADKKR